MASATAMEQKRLAEFLMEQQEPFVLDNYLLERGFSKRPCSLHKSPNSCLYKNAKFLLPFSKVLRSLCKKIASHNHTGCTTKEGDIRKDDLFVPETPTIDDVVEETDRFSSASSSTLFNSCSEIDEQENSISSQKDHPSFSSDTCQPSNACHNGQESQQVIYNGKHWWRCVGSVSLHKIPSRRTPLSKSEVAVNENVRRTEKKIREEWISSAAIWGLFIQTVKKESGTRKLGERGGANVSQVLKSKRVLQKTKQLLFDCMRDTATNFPGKDNGEKKYKQFLGPHDLGKLVSKRTKEWSVVTRGGISLDELNSMSEWNELELHVKDSALEIADAIWECINHEIVSEFIEYLPVI